MLIEYKVRKIDRYIITRYEETGPDAKGGDAACSGTRGEYENADVAFEVAYALCKAEHERMGWLPGDDRIRYPEHPNAGSMAPAIPAVTLTGAADCKLDADSIRASGGKIEVRAD